MVQKILSHANCLLALSQSLRFDMETVICRRCLLRDMQGKEAEYYESVLKYRKTLDEITGVSDTVYEERLTVCIACDALQNGTCFHCGCFVEMRAALRKMRCPDPNGDRWL